MTALELSKKYKTLLEKNGINTMLRLAHFFAQLDHESGLVVKRENMNYSAERLLQVFPKYFNAATAQQYARKPEAIANRVYANRMGNGNEASGDGWKYRGGGFLQHTGKNEYKTLKERTGIDYVAQPELLLNEADALIAALDYWNRSSLSLLADKDDLDGISDVINIGRKTAKYGDSNGFADRAAKLKLYKTVFK
ncbi:glycoside hydrolase family 19 protein [Chryseobacterium taichungense]|uniref:glycoside hydrolase family 19 protein n=1 Tax=Chryseobacterium taichungense TaxID=295069 RepID=UPI0028B1DC48|nr:glycoside hydrolase family 19 protein [Chryseobacterium taichungense]